MARDIFDVEEFLEDNAIEIRDYDSFLTELQKLRPTVSSRPYFPGTYDAPTAEEKKEIVHSVIIDQQRLSPYKEYFTSMTSDEQKLEGLKELSSYMIPDFYGVAKEILPESLYEELVAYGIQNQLVNQSKVLETSAGKKLLENMLSDYNSQTGLDVKEISELPMSIQENLYQQAMALSGAPGSAAFAQFYGYSQEDAVFNFNFDGGTLVGGPVYRQGMASGLLASMSEDEVANLQSKLIEAGYLSPFASYTLFDSSDPSTINALGKAMAAHNKRVGATPELDIPEQSEILQGVISIDLTNKILNKLNTELQNDVSTVRDEERTRLYGVNELTLAAATERADTIAGQVVGRDIDMVTAGKLAEVYKNIYNEKYQEVVKTALDKAATGREAELQRIQDIQAGKTVDDTRFVGLPASAETEGTVPTTEELAQQAATFAKLDFARKLKDTYFAQEMEDNDRKAAITQASIGFNTALRTLGG